MYVVFSNKLSLSASGRGRLGLLGNSVVPFHLCMDWCGVCCMSAACIVMHTYRHPYLHIVMVLAYALPNNALAPCFVK